MPTLYITEPGSQVHKSNNRLIIKNGKEILEAIPITKIDQVVLMGRGVSVTTAALHALTRRGIGIVYLTGTGGYVSRMTGPEHKHSRLRFQQAQWVSRREIALETARSIVHGKILNQRTLVQRHAKQGRWAKRALVGMGTMAERAKNARSVEELRGLEGQGAKEYFGLLRQMLRPPEDGGSWRFERRAYYPPPDPVNALLSFAYTLLLRDLVTACELAGLDPYLGCLHEIDYGRPSMALDLIEEFRPIIADSIVLFVVNRPMVRLSDFKEVPFKKKVDAREMPEDILDTGKRSVFLTGEAKKDFLAAFEHRVNELVYYPGSGEKRKYRDVFQLQVYQMTRVIMGEEKRYTPFVVR
ncbi:MAG: CRISPR-associated endonuclease Cas1 [Anaerolineae bacterium]|jgi:CRISP-associated protein Cas1|nr:CRISPR-associated endonuclease Cas1 [Anaerolineae bacterium]